MMCRSTCAKCHLAGLEFVVGRRFALLPRTEARRGGSSWPELRVAGEGRRWSYWRPQSEARCARRPAHHRPKLAAAGPRAASTEVVCARPGQGFGVGPKLCRSLLRSLKSRRRLSRRLRAEGATRRPRVWRAKTDALRLEFATYTKIDKNCCSPSAQAEAWVRRRRLFRQ